jgi:UDP-glucuronate 4-epimerase
MGPVIVTGAAGFVGHSTAHRLLDRGETVIGDRHRQRLL